MNPVTLGEVVDFTNGGTPSRSKPEFWDGSTPWITGADITEDGSVSARSFISEAAVKASSTNVLPPGTVLLLTRTSVGKVAVLPEPMAINQDITAITPSSRLDTRYLVHFLRSSKSKLMQNLRGATIKGVTRDDVASLEIALPPLSEQRQIAAMLDNADALRTKRRDVLALLDGLGPAIFRDMFGNPVTNERRWPVKRLAELGTLDRGVSKHRPRNDPALLGGAYPLIQTGDVANSGGYIRQFHSTYSDLGLAQSRMWPAGTLCITIAANIAKTGILTFNACFPDSVVGFTSDPETITFVQAWLGFLQATLEASAPQSAQKNINLAILRELKVPIPGGDLLKEFDERISALKEHRARTGRDQAELDAVFDSLQSRAFRGEL